MDESGFAPSAERQHGWAPRGEKVYGLRSGERRPRTSLIAARIGRALAAPMLFEGTCNTAVFNAWLAQELCPLLDETMVVVMDNAAFHTSPATREIIHATGAQLLFLPPYSPDLNPIENTFGTIKRNRNNDPDKSLKDIINVDAIVAGRHPVELNVEKISNMLQNNNKMVGGEGFEPPTKAL